ncbi:MAG: UDP-N-acetylglucosamine 2-epimerase [Planctomycetota bacterium]|jgi:UDP-N-acetylglucosamine 2-epimerase
MANVRVTGNSVVSAIERYTKAKPTVKPSSMIVVTFHRREVQNPEDAPQLAGAVVTMAIAYPSVRFLWPLHPGFVRFIPHKDLALLRQFPNVDFVEPMGYAWFVEELAGALGVITDSGGLVEECATLGVPCVIARDANDRPEAVEEGVAVVTAPTREGVSDGIKLLVNEAIPRRASPLYGTSDSASQIALHLANGMR